jgi:putative heme-binding domain-containing protein
MFRFGVPLLLLLCIAVPTSAQPKSRDPNIADTPPLTPEEQLKKFKLPPGFAIQLVAAEPKIKKPINIAFDFHGRLWLTGSEEYPFPAPADRKGKDTVKILEDFDDNGLARKVTTFAEGLNIPIGVLPLPDEGALVYSIPSIWRIYAKDGVADRKEQLYTAYGFKDTHGMTGEFVWGLDGWVYCCHGFSNTSTVKAKSGQSITMTSGNTYRIKIDGSKIEYFTHGQVNPFGLCFDPWGNLYSADCHTRPLYQLLKGAWYPSFGRPHDGLGFGPEMVTHDHGSTAIAGIVYTADDLFPKEFQDNLFVGNVVTNRINRDRIEWHGSTPKGIEMPDFVKCDDPWFRPVDIKLGPDGALYVADFYNRIIGHYEVPLTHPGRDREKGRIWRIVALDENGKPKLHPVKDLAKATDDELVAALGHPNLTVRYQATQMLVHRKAWTPAVQQALANGTPLQRAHAVWISERLGKLEIGAMSKDPAIVRVHHMRAAAAADEPRPIHPDFFVIAQSDPDAFVRRACAETLGARNDGLGGLLQMRAKVDPKDTHLLHVIRIGLVNQFHNPPTADAILTMAQLRDAEYLADVAPAEHSVIGAEFLAKYLELHPKKAAARKDFVHAVVRYGNESHRDAMFDLIRNKFGADLSTQSTLVRAAAQALQERGEKLNGPERNFAMYLSNLQLQSKKASDIQEGIDLAQSLRMADSFEPLLGLVRERSLPGAQRKNAIAALVAIDPAKSQQPLAQILLDDKENLAVREQVAQALASLNQPKTYDVLIGALTKAPAALQTTIALGMAGSPQGSNKLLDAVAAGKASPRLLQERGVVLKLQQARIKGVDDRIASLTKGLPAADERIQQLIGQRRSAFLAAKSDAAKGRLVFEKSCANCHQIANQGAKVGPQLDGVGIRGVDRLLEDILDPNRNVDQAFRSTILALDNGQFLTGLVLREEGQVIVLADAQGKEVRVSKANVQERSVGPLSPMPANFAEQISAADFNDLLAYLLSQRVKE